MPLKLMYITNNPAVALIAQKYGVDRIWVDLETLNKAERQKNITSVKSNHTVRDVEIISKMLTTSEMQVRVNPWNGTSVQEIEAVIAAGADIIMLPMWRTVDEVKNFLDAVNGRAKTILLLETKEAEMCLDSVLRLNGVDEIHIGLNDLHLSYGLTFMFELLSNGTVERICRKIKPAGLPYGFGGIARIGGGLLPAERILMEHYRLGSTRAILSRSFCDANKIGDIESVEKIFDENMPRLRKYEEALATKTEAEYAENRRAIECCVNEIVSKLKRKKAL